MVINSSVEVLFTEKADMVTKNDMQGDWPKAVFL